MRAPLDLRNEGQAPIEYVLVILLVVVVILYALADSDISTAVYELSSNIANRIENAEPPQTPWWGQ